MILRGHRLRRKRGRSRGGVWIVVALMALLPASLTLAGLPDPPDLPDIDHRDDVPTGIPAEMPEMPPQRGDLWTDPITGMTFSWVPAGCFLMGCGPWTADCDPDETPVRKVCLDAFWMARHEVTQREWDEVLSDNPADNQTEIGTHPVENIEWKDAIRYVKKLTDDHRGKYKFRVPSEAQWEYACRGAGLPQSYSGGNDVDRVSWHNREVGAKQAFPVEGKAPNALGLYDMSGNVWEWTADAYHDQTYAHWLSHGRQQKNPVFMRSQIASRVLRGGSYKSLPHETRCTNRQAMPRLEKQPDIGLRILRLP